MSEGEISLPEKSYFSVPEIAERWGCSSEQVIRYMDEGFMRPAIKSEEIYGLGIFDIVAIGKVEEREGRKFQSNMWCFASTLSSDTERAITVAAVWWSRESQFYYINREHVEHIGNKTVVSVLEDLDGHEFGLLRGSDTCEPGLHDITRLVLCGEESPYLLCQYPYTWNRFEVIVSREERDRFESEHEIFSPHIEHRSEYETAYLKVLRAAIFEFFDPRRQYDAKSEEVIEWIADQLRLAGLEGSRRIAHAMFTIIKPVDHNPRKRRG